MILCEYVVEGFNKLFMCDTNSIFKLDRVAIH